MRFKIDWALYLRAISKYKPPVGLMFGGAIQRRVYCVSGLGGLYLEGLIFGILRYSSFQFQINKNEREICVFENGFKEFFLFAL